MIYPFRAVFKRQRKCLRRKRLIGQASVTGRFLRNGEGGGDSITETAKDKSRMGSAERVANFQARKYIQPQCTLLVRPTVATASTVIRFVLGFNCFYYCSSACEFLTMTAPQKRKLLSECWKRPPSRSTKRMEGYSQNTNKDNCEDYWWWFFSRSRRNHHRRSRSRRNHHRRNRPRHRRRRAAPAATVADTAAVVLAATVAVLAAGAL